MSGKFLGVSVSLIIVAVVAYVLGQKQLLGSLPI